MLSSCELSFSRRQSSLQGKHLLWGPAADLSHLRGGNTVQEVLGCGKLREPPGVGQGDLHYRGGMKAGELAGGPCPSS